MRSAQLATVAVADKTEIIDDLHPSLFADQ